MGFGAAVLLPALKGIPGVRLAALADGGSGRAATLCRDMQGSVAALDDGKELAELDGLDAVIVAVPPEQQAPIVRAAVAKGRAVFCEKPLGISFEEAEQMTGAARSAGVANALGFQFRYEPGLRRLIEGAQAGMIGAIHRIDVDWLTRSSGALDRAWSWKNDAKAGGGVLPEMCSHVLDYTSLIAGAPIDAGSMTARTVVRERRYGAECRVVTAPDCVELLVRLGETTAHISISNVEPVPVGHRVAVHGEKGRLIFHHRPPFTAQDASLRLETGGEEATDLELPRASLDEGDSRIAASSALLADFVAAIHGERPPLLPDFAAGLAARRAMRLAEVSQAW
jgi:predicted dehydrogenase